MERELIFILYNINIMNLNLLDNYEYLFELFVILFLCIIFKKNIIIIILLTSLIIMYLDYYRSYVIYMPTYFLKGDSYKQNNPKKIVIKDKIFIYFYSDLLSHYGDLFFNVFYFNFIKDYCKKNKIYIVYSLNKCHHLLIKSACTNENLILKSISMDGINLINTNNLFKNNYEDKIKGLKYLDILLRDFYNEVSKYYSIDYEIKIFLNNDDTLEIQYKNLIKKYGDKYDNIDILFINSIPNSGQYNYNVQEWNDFISFMKKIGLKVVTTYKVKDITCTLDDKLSLNDIGVISIKSKIIIAINTGPLIPCLNTKTMENIKNLYLFDRNNLSYNKVTYCANNSINIIDKNKLYIEIKNMSLLS